MALELRRKKNNKKILPPNTGFANNMIRRTALILVSSVSPGCQVCGLTAAKKGEGVASQNNKGKLLCFYIASASQQLDKSQDKITGGVVLNSLFEILLFIRTGEQSLGKFMRVGGGQEQPLG